MSGYRQDHRAHLLRWCLLASVVKRRGVRASLSTPEYDYWIDIATSSIVAGSGTPCNSNLLRHYSPSIEVACSLSSSSMAGLMFARFGRYSVPLIFSDFCTIRLRFCVTWQRTKPNSRSFGIGVQSCLPSVGSARLSESPWRAVYRSGFVERPASRSGHAAV